MGCRGSAEGVALVDTGAIFMLLDRDVAEFVGVRYTGKTVELVTVSGHELKGELALVDKIVVEGEDSPYARVVVIVFSEELKESLRRLNVCDYCILGLLTLEELGLMPDTTTGMLRKVPILWL